MKNKTRIANCADAKAIALVHVTSWQETYKKLLPPNIIGNLSVDTRTMAWKTILSHEDSLFGATYVAENNDKIVGFIHGSTQRDKDLLAKGFTGEITSIYVLKKYQNQGVGTKLIKVTAQMLMNSNHNSAALWVLETNIEARSFYERKGGKIVEKKEKKRKGFTIKEVAYGWRDLSYML